MKKTKKTPPRLAFYSHDTMGLGHIRRNMLLANAVLNVRPDTEILLINGVRESGVFYFPSGMDSVTLPTYHKTSEGAYLPNSLGNDVHRLVTLRRKIIHAALDAFEPDVVVIDNVPRGAMSELDAVLPMLKEKGTHLVLGLRDIIDEPEAVHRQWEKLNNRAAIRDYFSEVWVYGDAGFYDLTRAYALEEEICQKVAFMGYLDASGHAQQPKLTEEILEGIDRPYVLCTVGGGQDGFRLASTFAQATFPSGVMGVLLTGTMMPPADYEALQQIASERDDLLVIRFVPNPLVLLRQAKSVVAMGGYNTTIEILSLNKSALIVPRVAPRQEQWIRASRLAGLNLISCIHPQIFSLAALNDWIAAEWQPAAARERLDLNGLHNFTEKMSALFQHRNK